MDFKIIFYHFMHIVLNYLNAKNILICPNMTVRRLNRVVSLVRVFEELSHVTSPFWSSDKVNPGICLFHEQDLRRADHGGSLLSGEHMRTSSYIPDLRRVSGFHLFFFFLLYELLCLFLERLYNLKRDLSSLRVLCTIKCLIILIDLLCFLPNILFGIT